MFSFIFCLNLHCVPKDVLQKFRFNHKCPTDTASLKTADLIYIYFVTENTSKSTAINLPRVCSIYNALHIPVQFFNVLLPILVVLSNSK